MAVYPLEPIPVRALLEFVRWPEVSVEFDRIYRQTRALTDRPLRRVQLTYEGLSETEVNVLRTFHRLMKGRQEIFDYVHFVNEIADGGFEAGPLEEEDPTKNLAVNPNFTLGDVGWFSDAGVISVVYDPANAYGGSSYVAKAPPGVNDTLRNLSGRFSVSPFELIYVSGWVRSTPDADGVAHPRVVVHNAALTSEEPFHLPYTSGPAPRWTKTTGAWWVSANAAWAQVEFEVLNHSRGTWYGGGFYVCKYSGNWNLKRRHGNHAHPGADVRIQSEVVHTGNYALKIAPGWTDITDTGDQAYATSAGTVAELRLPVAPTYAHCGLTTSGVPIFRWGRFTEVFAAAPIPLVPGERMLLSFWAQGELGAA
ncbi:MAG: hypothetical protein QW761_02980, partial [Candidatus Aenigmatarchaeota archaeon]